MSETNARTVTPVIPLPNPGEGGPVYDGSSNTGATPVIPLPNPGEGGAVYPGGSTVTVVPGIQTTAWAAVRFFNGSSGYPAFHVYIDNVRVTGMLDSGDASSYVRIPAGRHTISVRAANGYTYLEMQMTFQSSGTSTVAIIDRTGGLRLVRVSDPCRVV